MLKGGTHAATGPVIICVIIKQSGINRLWCHQSTKKVAKYMYGGWGKMGERVGWKGGEGGARKRTVGEGERARRARLAGRA